ncbi:MAG: hypothetical protein KAT05_08320, partial [Spirochaetes bacterium]|nr:hypothetical protein [Spirochaetota bacterium]
LANENSRINELNKGIMDQGNEHNVENIIDKKDITKGLNRKAKGITKDIANNKIETNDNDKIIKDVQKVKLDYKSLDFNTKEKVKAIIRDLKSGKINEMTANAFIARILKNVGVKNTKLLNKKKLSRVKINEKKNNSELKLESKKNDADTDSKINKLDNFNKSNDKNFIDNSMSSQSSRKNIKKIINLNNEQNKNDDLNVKELKFEINLNNSENKLNDSMFNRDKITGAQKTLEQNKQALFQQIAKNTKIVLSQQQTKFSTMIRPDNFGRMDFRFVIKDGKINGRMILQSMETADFFRANVEEMRAVFQKANVELENIEIILAGNKFSQQDHDHNKEFVNEDNVSIKQTLSPKNQDYFEENNSLLVNNYSQKGMSLVDIVV